VHEGNINPVHGRFSLVVRPGYVYSLTTTTGQGKGGAAGPPAAGLKLPYDNNLSSGVDGEPSLLAAQAGAFELRRCQAPDGASRCTRQTAVGQPVFWRIGVAQRHPYAVLGDDWRNYAVSAEVRLPQSGTAGLMGRYDSASASPSQGTYNAYVFDVSTAGTYTISLYRSHDSGKRLTIRTLVSGSVSFPSRVWHKLTLSFAGAHIAATIDGVQVASTDSAALARGIPGIEVGGWYPAQFSDLTISAS
jgi:hypothetical protein